MTAPPALSGLTGRHSLEPPLSLSDSILARAKRIDRLMAWVISFGGLVIIAAVMGILVFITREALPLFRAPKVKAQPAVPGVAALAVLPDDTGKAYLAFDAAQGVRAHRTDQPEPMRVLEEGPARPWKSMSPLGARGSALVLGADDRIALVQAGWDRPGGEADPANWTPKAEWTEAIPAGAPVTRLWHGKVEAGGGLSGGQTLKVLAQQGETLALGTAETTPGATFTWQPLPVKGLVSAALLSADARSAFVGLTEGTLLQVGLEGEPTVLASASFGQPISALGFALGQVSLLVGGEKGGVAAFQVLSRSEGPQLQRFHEFQPLRGAVKGFSPSLRDKRFLVWTDQEVAVDYLTTEQRLMRVDAPATLQGAMGARGDQILSLDANGQIRRWHLDAPHPQITAKTLWGKVHYESYEKPEYVWQSSGGSDDFEPKLSLVPLIFGTLKGTLYAMFFALPLAIFGALYTSQFASPRLRNAIKPTVEIMAALPSVVLGFVAGLVLAPLFERAAVHVVLMPLAALTVGALALPLWARLPRAFKQAWGEGREVLWVIPVILLGLAITLSLAPWFEKTFLAGDFRTWLLGRHGLIYDQRNALVVGFAMGFAVIPIVFTISEDALSSVPRSLTSASLACGASPWQTAWRVVLPTASPGIFSSVMIGFGRAIGETMIVLMATGNTPILDWSPFNGMRTMSATIAVEAPEAPEAGTLYRVLFLTALLLFILTFLLNTLAELIRQHLRKRYESF